MPHSYGASFSGVGFFGPRTLERRTEISAKPAPSAIMIRMESQPCIAVKWRLVNDFTKPSPHANTPVARSFEGRETRDILETRTIRGRYDEPADAHRLVFTSAANPLRHRQ